MEFSSEVMFFSLLLCSCLLQVVIQVKHGVDSKKKKITAGAKIKEGIKKGEILVDAKKIWREREDHNNNGNKEAGKWGRVREND